MIVTCPVCHNETLDNCVTCSHCGWKYDGITHELEISPINGYVCPKDYRELYAHIWRSTQVGEEADLLSL